MDKDLKKELAIILIEFNTPDVTIECLKTVDKYLGRNCKVFIYDNSKEKSLSLLNFINSSNLETEYHWNGKNIGFAVGCNLGMKNAFNQGFEFAMLLNNDTLLVDSSPLDSIKFFENNPNLAIVGIVNYFENNPSLIWQSGKNFNGLKFGFKSAIMSNGKLTYCDYVPGSSFIYRTRINEEIGFFDENYFAYYEEIDFCYRVKQRGYEIAFINDSRILHKVGESSTGKIKVYLKTRNKLYFYKKITKSKIKFVFFSILFVLKDLISIFVVQRCVICVKYLYLGIYDFMTEKMKFKRFE